jgi:hypothetical protein
MNHSQSPPVELEELTIGEIRRALAQGGAEETLREALARLVETDEADRRSVAGDGQDHPARLRHRTSEAAQALGSGGSGRSRALCSMPPADRARDAVGSRPCPGQGWLPRG